SGSPTRCCRARGSSRAGRTPPSELVERLREKGAAAGATSDLAARGPGDAAGLEQDKSVEVCLVLLGDGTPDRFRDRADVRGPAWDQLVRNDQLFLAVLFDGEGRPTARLQVGVAAL